MDDTYIWTTCARHMQRILTCLNQSLPPKGLDIHPETMTTQASCRTQRAHTTRYLLQPRRAMQPPLSYSAVTTLATQPHNNKQMQQQNSCRGNSTLPTQSGDRCKQQPAAAPGNVWSTNSWQSDD